MIEPKTWTQDVLAKLRKEFGERLLYLGLQGSYRRGEATGSSDIDLVVLLENVSLDDLDAYRKIVRGMPEGDKACGFICGMEDFKNWPRHELFPFRMDTEDAFGTLDDFLPEITREDIRRSAHIGASGLLHMLTHSYIYADDDARPGILQSACKSAFFIMQVVQYLASGIYPTSKKAILEQLKGEDREIIMAGLDFHSWIKMHSEKHAFEILRKWCQKVLASTNLNPRQNKQRE